MTARLHVPSPSKLLEEHTRLTNETKTWLVNKIRTCDPQFFEVLVLRLLLAMKYGVTGEVTQAARDGGVDGVIFQDQLGLSQFMFQAKRWSRTVGRPEVQAFAGALQGKHIDRGVLIATANISKEARQYVETIPTRIVLIDGWQMATLLYEHNLGVQSITTIETKVGHPEFFGPLTNEVN